MMPFFEFLSAFPTVEELERSGLIGVRPTVPIEERFPRRETGSRGIDPSVAWANAVAQLLAARGGAELDPAWVLQGVQQQLRFWSALESALTGAKALAVSPPEASSQPSSLLMSGSRADFVLNGRFFVVNPNTEPLILSIAIAPFLDEHGATVSDEVCTVDQEQTARSLEAGERREIVVSIYPARLPGPGSFRGRLTVRTPRAWHLDLDVRIRPE
jgi:hypothetical protein